MGRSSSCPAGRLHVIALVLTCFPRSCASFLLSVDLGSQYFKAALVAPGKPFEIVHNQHSKRKTPTAISFYEKIRTFGDDAITSASRGAAKTPMFFPRQLGQNLTATASSGYNWLPKATYPYTLGVSASGSLRFDFGDDVYTIEEVTAHLLNFAKDLAREAADGIAVTETILTITSTAGMHQRRTLLDAARIAGLPRPSLIHETSAAALQRALDLDLSAKNGTSNQSTVLFYNMGARHVEACVVSCHHATHLGKDTVEINVLGCGVSEELGGHYVDLLIVEKMLANFQAKHPKLADGIVTSARAMRKLEKEAMSLKHVLSANKEGLFRVEGLYEDTDFAQPVTRETLDKWCEPLFASFDKPIEEALTLANTTLESVDAVELVGGGWRIPRIQELLGEYFTTKRPDMPTLNLSQHVNGDEAMATGAAFYGANSSASFRTKKLFFSDLTIHHYTLLLVPLNVSQPHENGWKRELLLFPSQSKLRAKKTLKLNIGFDLQASLLEDDKCVLHWTIAGIHKAATGTHAALGTPLLSLKFELDSSAVVQIQSATAIFDQPMADSPPELFANASDTGANSSGPSDNESIVLEPESPDEAESSNASNDTSVRNASSVKPNTPKTTKLKVPLLVTESYEGVSPRALSDMEQKHAFGRLADMNAADAEVRRVAAAKNALESYVYESRSKLSDDEACLQVSTEAERAEVIEMLTHQEEWLYEEEAAAANASALEGKLRVLKERVSPILGRAYELEQRPLMADNVDKFRKAVNTTLNYVKTNMTWVEAKERESVANLSALFEEWWANVSENQSRRLLTEEPAYTVRDVERAMSRVASEAQRLTKIKKIDPMPYSDYGRGYAGYGGYGGRGYGRYGGYDDPRMRAFYENMYRNFTQNGSNNSDWWNFSNFSNFNSWNDSEYMRSYYEHAARNFTSENASDSTESGGSDTGKTEL